jgi:hypothetical protein
MDSLYCPLLDYSPLLLIVLLPPMLLLLLLCFLFSFGFLGSNWQWWTP